MAERTEIPAAISPEEKEDIISSLPDEVVFEILDHLQSLGEASKFSALSKTWFHLWHSYLTPIFDVREFRSTKRLKGLVTDDQEKKDFPATERDLATLISPREIDIKCELSEPHVIPRGLLLSRRFRGLKVLKLQNFDFVRYANVVTEDVDEGEFEDEDEYENVDEYEDEFSNEEEDEDENENENEDENEDSNPFAGLGSSLNVLCLDQVSFPDERILKSIIKAASLLETLTLSKINDIETLQIRDKPNLKTLTLSDLDGIKTLQVRDNPNLKTLEVDIRDPGTKMEDFEIIGAHSLETLSIGVSNSCCIRVPTTPNLKALYIDGALMLREKDLNKLISKSPSLESLTLIDLDQIHKLRIVNNPKLREVKLHVLPCERLMVIQIDAPMLTDFYYKGELGSFPELKLLHKKPNKPEAELMTSFYCRITGDDINYIKLNELIRKWSQFKLTLEFSETVKAMRDEFSQFKVRPPLPVIECVKLESRDDEFLNNLNRICNPKIVTYKTQRSKMNR
ncbi:hypothetical protein LINPERPRIM_LOCUS3289 [Linum perenne]